MATRSDIINGAEIYLAQVKSSDPSLNAIGSQKTAILESVYDEVQSECFAAHEWQETLDAQDAFPVANPSIPQQYRREKVILAVPPKALEIRRVVHPQAISRYNPEGSVEWFAYRGKYIIANRMDNFSNDSPTPYSIWFGSPLPIDDVTNPEFLRYLKISLAIRAVPASEVNDGDFYSYLIQQQADALMKAKAYDERFEGIGFWNLNGDRNVPTYDGIYDDNDDYGNYGGGVSI